MSVTVYHNPGCGTSRRVLEILRGRGLEPRITLYLKTPPPREHWTTLIARSALGARAFLRNKEKLYAELDLANPQWTDEQLIEFLTEHPVLLNRPVVATPKAVRPCQPAETVLEMLDQSQQ